MGPLQVVVGIFVAPMSVAIAGVVAYGLFQVFTG